MIKILHSADWHLDSPLLHAGSSRLRQTMDRLPDMIGALCKQEQCHMMVLCGDIFDGAYTENTLERFKAMLRDVAVPVFITPGNHDHIGTQSPWLRESWPENVHVFTHPVLEAVPVPELDCCVYGAGYVSPDCQSLLQDFIPSHAQRYSIGAFHGDPAQSRSPYAPVTAPQVERSGFDYLALGHIHKAGSFKAGSTLCGWPGCPMGRGFDEDGEKGVYIVTLGEETACRFVSLDTPRFYDITVSDGVSLEDVLPVVGSEDHYRVTFTGSECKPDLPSLQEKFSHFPNLTLRDRTVLPSDIWSSAGEDTFEGAYFRHLAQAMEACSPEDKKHILLAARISRQLLDGQEVVLP